ncbi:MAG TPA: sulfite exporter TauE/SafE family protein, partial [bacterium]|nr:sulfite exporter TauE/SafE family protein [bacterium]
MYELLATGLAMGFAATPACLAWCLPLLLPLSLAQAGTSRAAAARGLLLFLAGRLAGYLLFGLLAGWLGGMVAAERLGATTPWLYLGAAALLLWSLRRRPGASCGCRRRWPMLALGFATGFNLCPPFLAAAGVALTIGSIAPALVFFTAFFVGTSLPLLPLPLVAPASRRVAVVAVARAAGVFAAGWLIVAAGSMLLPVAPATDNQDELAALLPEAARSAAAPGPLPCTLLYNRAGALLGAAFNTAVIAPEITGFSGPVPLAVVMAPDGTIRAARFLPNQETPAYFAKLTAGDWAGRLVGRRITDPLTPGTDLDAVTGATISTRAAARGLRVAGQAVYRDLFAGSVSAGDTAAPALPWRLLAMAAFCAAAVAAYARAARRFRLILLAAGALITGFWLQEYVSLEHVIALLRGGLTGHSGVLLLVMVALAAAVFTGRFYCGWLCPFGALQELLALLRP